MSFSVKGKTAIVTGAGSGICFAFAKLLLDRGCSVLLADLALRPESEALVGSFYGGGSARAVFHRTDVTKWEQLDSMFERAVGEFGGFDIVCPGAGVYEPLFSNFWHAPGTTKSRDAPSGSRYASLDINLVHPIYCTQQAVDYFTRSRKPGAVVHVSSIAAQVPVVTAPLYVAAKSGLSNFVRSLAVLEKPGNPNLPSVRVNAVAPGVIKTPLWTENPEKLAWIDSARDVWVEPEEVAEAMLDLIEKDEFVGGTVLEVGKNQTRVVQVLNDAGPSGEGHTVSSGGKGAMEIWTGLASRAKL